MIKKLLLILAAIIVLAPEAVSIFAFLVFTEVGYGFYINYGSGDPSLKYIFIKSGFVALVFISLVKFIWYYYNCRKSESE